MLTTVTTKERDMSHEFNTMLQVTQKTISSIFLDFTITDFRQIEEQVKSGVIETDKNENWIYSEEFILQF